MTSWPVNLCKDFVYIVTLVLFFLKLLAQAGIGFSNTVLLYRLVVQPSIKN